MYYQLNVVTAFKANVPEMNPVTDNVTPLSVVHTDTTKYYIIVLHT